METVIHGRDVTIIENVRRRVQKSVLGGISKIRIKDHKVGLIKELSQTTGKLGKKTFFFFFVWVVTYINTC